MSRRSRLSHGVYVPVVTPFTKSGEVDIPKFNVHLAWLMRSGVAGIVVGGTTGEGHNISRGEKLEIIKAAADTRKHLGASGVHLIAGTGSQDFGESLAIYFYAREAGYDAVLALPPKSSKQDDIVDFYTTLSADIPGIEALAYNIPRISGVELSPRTIGTLVQRGFIAGVKDSSQSAQMLKGWKDANPDGLLAVGSDALILYGRHEIKAEMVISGIGNIMPDAVMEVYKSNGMGAADAQVRINQMSKKLASEGNYIGALKKEVMLRQHDSEHHDGNPS
jgi:4-hydroxy-tetrahydrodipicolinate synthase